MGRNLTLAGIDLLKTSIKFIVYKDQLWAVRDVDEFEEKIHLIPYRPTVTVPFSEIPNMTPVNLREALQKGVY